MANSAELCDKFVIDKQIQTTVRAFEIYVIFSVRIFNYIFRLIHAAWIILSYIRRIIRKRVTHIGVLVAVVTEYLPARRHFDIGRRGAGKRLVGYFVEIGKLPVGKQSNLRRSKFVAYKIFVGKRYIKTTCGQCADLGCEGVVVVVLHSAVLSLSDSSINVGVYVKTRTFSVMPDQFAKKLQKGEVLRVNLVITNNFCECVGG